MHYKSSPSRRYLSTYHTLSASDTLLCNCLLVLFYHSHQHKPILQFTLFGFRFSSKSEFTIRNKLCTTVGRQEFGLHYLLVHRVILLGFGLSRFYFYTPSRSLYLPFRCMISPNLCKHPALRTIVWHKVSVSSSLHIWYQSSFHRPFPHTYDSHILSSRTATLYSLLMFYGASLDD